jgi:hypothetical protein
MKVGRPQKKPFKVSSRGYDFKIRITAEKLIRNKTCKKVLQQMVQLVAKKKKLETNIFLK